MATTPSTRRQTRHHARGLLAALSALTLVLAAGAPALAAPGPDDTSATYLPSSLPAGIIPDGTSATCESSVPSGTYDVTIPVSGISKRITDVQVDLHLTHTWVGDLTVELLAPGGSPAFVVFGGTGRTPSNNCGHGSNLNGGYTFSDLAAGSWWDTILPGTDDTVIASGAYRTSEIGGAEGATGAPTTMTEVFAGLGAAANGDWTIRVTDRVLADTGTVNSASLQLTVDTTRPSTTIRSGPANGARLAAAPTYALGSSAADLAGFECRVDSGAFAPCPTRFTPAVRPGPHVVKVVAVDTSGNADASAVTRTFVLLTAPCAKATAHLAVAQKALKKAKKSGNRHQIAKAKKKVVQAKRAKVAACRPAPQ